MTKITANVYSAIQYTSKINDDKCTNIIVNDSLEGAIKSIISEIKKNTTLDVKVVDETFAGRCFTITFEEK